jgi:uncharacterized repeat protein (TIGR03803 family)
VIGPGGALYVTTFYGGNGFCGEFACGTVTSLRPPQNVCRSVSCPWTATTTYSFSGPDGNGPELVDPVFDSAGNMYGSTYEGGANYDGNVFRLTRSNGQWTGTSIHDFNGSDGNLPYSSVTLDAPGNVYGTTWMGGPTNNGVVYRLTNSGSGWTYTMLYGFQGAADGTGPVGGLVLDQAGNLYGATGTGGSGGGGTVYELSPSGGGWNFSLLYSFTANGYDPGPLNTWRWMLPAISTAPPSAAVHSGTARLSSSPTTMEAGAIPICTISPTVAMEAIPSEVSPSTRVAISMAPLARAASANVLAAAARSGRSRRKAEDRTAIRGALQCIGRTLPASP